VRGDGWAGCGVWAEATPLQALMTIANNDKPPSKRVFLSILSFLVRLGFAFGFSLSLTPGIFKKFR
jgi:hypothetical protein